MAEKDSWAVGSDTDRRVDVEDARAALSALLAPSSGIAGRAGFLAGPTTQGQVTASGTPNASVNVAAFQVVLANSRGIFPYTVTLDAPKTVDVLVANPSDPTNARRDLIIAQQSDAYYGDASSPFEVKRITGTAAASPSDPAVPGSPDYITLARVTVTAGATTITSGMITDLRPAPLTVARGGVLPCTSSTRPSVPYSGMVIYETDTGIMRVWNATSAAWRQVLNDVGGTVTTEGVLRLPQLGNATATSATHSFQIGASTTTNLRADANEVLAANNGAPSTLNLNVSSAGLVQVGTGGLDVNGTTTLDGATTVNAAATINNLTTMTPATGSGSKAIAFNHSYAVWVDNIAADGGAGSRMWLDTPDNGDVVIGPRGGSDFINQLRLRTDSTTASAANVYMNPTGNIISRSTSSLRYKVDVQDLVLDLAAVRALRPVRFRDRGEVERDPDTTQTYVGLIAEEVDALGLHSFVSYMEDENGDLIPDGVQYDRLTVALHMLVTELEDTVAAQAEQIQAQTATIADLVARVEALEGGA